MNRIILIAAAISGLAAATPAAADTGRSLAHARTGLTLDLTANACERNLAASDCSVYQTRLLATAARPVDARQRATLREVGRQQLDALIASIN